MLCVLFVFPVVAFMVVVHVLVLIVVSLALFSFYLVLHIGIFECLIMIGIRQPAVQEPAAKQR